MSTSIDSTIQQYILSQQYTQLITAIDAYLKLSAKHDPSPTPIHQYRYIKAIAAIYTDQFTIAIDILKSLSPLHQFELCYAQYRSKQYSNALQTIQSIEQKQHTIYHYHLLAQIYYRLNQFAQCEDVYNTYLSADVSTDIELQTNIISSYIAAYSAGNGIQFLQNHHIDTNNIEDGYELLYNIASLYASYGDIAAAINTIVKSEQIARNELSDQLNKKNIIELERELVQITAQNAYIQSLANNTTGATKLYKRVLSLKSTDSSTIATCNNNLVALQFRDNGTVDKDRLYGIDTKDDKLSDTQRTTILINRMTVLLINNKYNSVIRQSNRLIKSQPNNEVLTVVHAYALMRQKKIDQCQTVLDSYITANPTNSLYAQLMLVQLQLQAKDDKSAVYRLNQLNTQYTLIRYQPASVSILYALYTKLNDSTSINELYNNAVQYWSKSMATDANINNIIISQHYANYQAKHSQWSDVANTYQRLLSINTATQQQTSLWTIKLIHARRCDKIHDIDELVMTLPNTELDVSGINIDDLEQRLTGLTKSSTSTVTANSNKSKRKIRYPLNYDPLNPSKPDPERWLPKYERTNYRSKKSNKRMTNEFRGAQGSANVSSTSTSNTVINNNNSTAQRVESSSAQTSAAAKKAAQKKKKGKK